MKYFIPVFDFLVDVRVILSRSHVVALITLRIGALMFWFLMRIGAASLCCHAIALITGVPDHFMLCWVLFEARPGATSVVALITLVKKYLYEHHYYDLPVEQDILTQGHIYHTWWLDHHHGWYKYVSIKQVYPDWKSQCSQEWTLSVRFIAINVPDCCSEACIPRLKPNVLLTPF